MIILLLILFLFITPAGATVYWSESFDGFTQEWVCQIDNCALVPGVPPGYSEFHANTMGTPDSTTSITTAAHRGTAGTNKRGFRIVLGANVFPTGENVLKKDVGSNLTGTLFLRWYQRDSAPASYTHFQKLFRLKQSSGQILIPEWQVNGANVQMNLWDANTNSNHFFTGYNLTAAEANIWKCYEIKMDLTNKQAEFWVDGVSKGTLNASSWWTTGWYVRNVEIGGNQYQHTVGATIDYDDIILSDTYNGCDSSPACTPLPSETRTSTPCPSGSEAGGIVTERRDSSCPGPTWGDWYVTNSTCVATCTPAASQTRTTTPCPTGFTGTITEQRDSYCPGPTWGTWYQLTNTCVATPIGDITPPTCVIIQGLAYCSSPYSTLLCSIDPKTIDLRSHWSESCTAKYADSNLDYANMTLSMGDEAGTYNKYVYLSLPCGATYTYYMKCKDPSGNIGETSTTFTILPGEETDVNINVGIGGVFLLGSGGAFKPE